VSVIAPATTTTTTTSTSTTSTSTTTTSTTLSPNSKFLNNLFASQETSDGKYIFVGNFTSYNGTTSKGIIKLNTDGTIDGSFNPGTGFNVTIVTNVINTLDNKYLVAGWFTTYQGVSANRIIKLNTDGSKDTSFNFGTGFNDVISDGQTLVNTSDNKYLIGGSFLSYNGTPAKAIIKLNTDGTIDTSFVYGTGFGGSVNSIIETSDGKYLIGGSFTSYQGVATNRIIRLNSDGSKDTSFVIGTGFGGNVYGFIETSDGKYLVVGAFSSYNGTSANSVIKLNTDGSKDTSFNYGIGFSVTDVRNVKETSDGKYLLGGGFTTYQGTSSKNLIKLNTNGTIDGSFVVGTGFNGAVYDIVETSDNKYLIGGSFSSYNGTPGNNFFKLNTNGSIVW